MKTKINMEWFLSSSANRDKLALTVKGLIVFITPMVIELIRSRGFEIQESDLNQFLLLSTQTVGLVATLIGFVRKIYLTKTK